MLYSVLLDAGHDSAGTVLGKQWRVGRGSPRDEVTRRLGPEHLVAPVLPRDGELATSPDKWSY